MAWRHELETRAKVTNKRSIPESSRVYVLLGSLLVYNWREADLPLHAAIMLGTRNVSDFGLTPCISLAKTSATSVRSMALKDSICWCATVQGQGQLKRRIPQHPAFPYSALQISMIKSASTLCGCFLAPENFETGVDRGLSWAWRNQWWPGHPPTPEIPNIRLSLCWWSRCT